MLRNQTRFERVSIFIFRSGHNPTCNWQKESNDFALHRQIVRDRHDLVAPCFSNGFSLLQSTFSYETAIPLILDGRRELLNPAVTQVSLYSPATTLPICPRANFKNEF